MEEDRPQDTYLNWCQIWLFIMMTRRFLLWISRQEREISRIWNFPLKTIIYLNTDKSFSKKKKPLFLSRRNQSQLLILDSHELNYIYQCRRRVNVKNLG